LTRITLTGDQYILFLLFLRLGIMASIAGVLVTSNYFKRLIFIQTRTRREDWWFALIFGALITAGTAVRLMVGYEGVAGRGRGRWRHCSSPFRLFWPVNGSLPSIFSHVQEREGRSA